jgi:outer membrane protein assembly factor BamB
MEKRKMSFTHNSKTTAAIIIVLFMASITLMAMSVEAGVTEIGTSPSTVEGYPNLGPLPAGVTPAYTFETTAYLSFRPNPIGVGQSLLINVWTTPGVYHAFYMADYKVTIQKPDGTTDVAGPTNSYLADATAWFEYVPTEPGTYKLKFEQPGTYIPAGVYDDRPGLPPGAGFGATPTGNYTVYTSVWYTPSSTDWQELTVQADMIASWPPSPLPTDYWTRPISPENREFWPIAGNYPWTGAYYYPNGRVLYSSNYQYTPYVQAPNTPHVLWKRQGAIAGLIGTDMYQKSLSAGGGTPSIVYSGRCYQTLTKALNGKTASVWQCYDLRTGNVYWELADVIAPTNILYETGTSDVPGADASVSISASFAAISNGRLYKYNPFTGALSANISLPAGITSGTIYNNEWVYSVQTINATANNYRLINWTMTGSSTNFTSRISSNVTWPRSAFLNLFGACDYEAGIDVSASWAPVDATRSPTGAWTASTGWCIGYAIESVDLRTGAVLFNINGNDTLHDNVQSGSSLVVNRGKIALSTHNRHYSCFDGRTGKKLWESELTDYPWGVWFAYFNTASYDFNESKSAIITSTYDGIYAIDWDNGKIIWHYSSASVPFEDPYSQEPFFAGVKTADGKVYAYSGEHSPSQPVTRGWHLHCINATTGEGIWKITGPMSVGAIADGYLTGSDPYDGYMYVLGKGITKTTVTTPDLVVANGTGLVIKGTVMDMSPAQPDTPCVSVDSMEIQMEYLHMQHPQDGFWHNETISGVPVVLTALGTDGSVIDVGTTTTNGYYGTFGITWTPPNQGEYTIMASFAGDDSYGSSSAAMMLSVGPTPTNTEQGSQQVQTPQDNTPLIYATIAIIAAIAIVGTLIILVLRKRQ